MIAVTGRRDQFRAEARQRGYALNSADVARAPDGTEYRWVGYDMKHVQRILGVPFERVEHWGDPRFEPSPAFYVALAARLDRTEARA